MDRTIGIQMDENEIVSASVITVNNSKNFTYRQYLFKGKAFNY